MKTTLFIQQLGDYFEMYLPKTGGYSQNTISSYKEVFRLLFKFMDEIKGIRHYLIDYKYFTAELIEGLFFGSKKNVIIAHHRETSGMLRYPLSLSMRRGAKWLHFLP